TRLGECLGDYALVAPVKDRRIEGRILVSILVNGTSERARGSSCSRQRLLRRKSSGLVHSEWLRVPTALAGLGWRERLGHKRPRRHARSAMLPLPLARHIPHSQRKDLSKVFSGGPTWRDPPRCFLCCSAPFRRHEGTRAHNYSVWQPRRRMFRVGCPPSY